MLLHRKYECDCSHSEPQAVIDIFKKIADSFNRWIQTAFSRGKSFFSREYYAENLNLFNEGIKQEYEGIVIKQDDSYLTLLQANIARFSAAKTLAMVKEMNKALLDNPNSFAEFKKAIDKTGEAYNRRYLETEYEFARAVAQMGAKHQRFIDEANTFPFVRYESVGDARVRQSHKALDGKIIRIGTREYDFLLPPLGWKCRCDFVQVMEGEASNFDEIKTILQNVQDGQGQSEYDNIIKNGFGVNLAKTAEIFKRNKLYVRGFNDLDLRYSDYELIKFSDMKLSQTVEPKQRTRSELLAWFNLRQKDNVIKLKDYEGLNLDLTEANFKKIIATKDAGEWTNNLQEIISNPSEVWLIESENGYTKRYLKFYKDTALMVEVIVKVDKPISIGWYGKIGPKNIEGWYRKGLLIEKR